MAADAEAVRRDEAEARAGMGPAAVKRTRHYCPTCGFPYRPIKTGKVPKHVNVNLRVGYNLDYPVCEMSGKKG